MQKGYVCFVEASGKIDARDKLSAVTAWNAREIKAMPSRYGELMTPASSRGNGVETSDINDFKGDRAVQS